MYLKAWSSYLPSKGSEVGETVGACLAPAEDCVTFAYESPKGITRGFPKISNLVIIPDCSNPPESIFFEILPELLDSGRSNIVLARNLSDAFRVAKDLKTEAVVSVVSEQPKAGSASFLLSASEGKFEIVDSYEIREHLNFALNGNPENSRNKALLDLLNDLFIAKVPSVVKEVVKSAGVQLTSIKHVVGQIPAPRALIKALTPLGIPVSAVDNVMKYLKLGFKGPFLSALALIDSLEKCDGGYILHIVFDAHGTISGSLIRCGDRHE